MRYDFSVGRHQEGDGRWLSLDGELIMKNGEVMGTQSPTGHTVLIDARFELPYGECKNIICYFVPYALTVLSCRRSRVRSTIQVEQLKKWNVSFPSSPFVHFYFCWKPVWGRGSVFGLRLPLLEFLSVWYLINLTILRRLSCPGLACVHTSVTKLNSFIHSLGILYDVIVIFPWHFFKGLSHLKLACDGSKFLFYMSVHVLACWEFN